MKAPISNIALVLAITGFACASAPTKPRYWLDVAISGHEEANVIMGRSGRCWGVMFAHVSFGDPVMIECTEGFAIDRCLETDWEVAVGHRLEKTFLFRDPDTQEVLACRAGWVTCYQDGAVQGTSVCFADPNEDPALKRNTGKPRLAVRAPPIVLPGTAGPYGAAVTFFVEVLGEIDEQWYCPALEVIWSDGTRSFGESDCDPWDGTQTQGARWSFQRGLAIGDHIIEFRLSKAGQVFAIEKVTITVSGSGE